MELDALDHVGLLVSDIDHRISRSLYVHDPDLHLVEITTYEIPPGKTSIGKKPE